MHWEIVFLDMNLFKHTYRVIFLFLSSSPLLNRLISFFFLFLPLEDDFPINFLFQPLLLQSFLCLFNFKILVWNSVPYLGVIGQVLIWFLYYVRFRGGGGCFFYNNISFTTPFICATFHVDTLERLGITRHFRVEIKNVVNETYR